MPDSTIGERAIPDSSAGIYSRPAGNIPTTGQTVEAIQVNSPIDDLSAAMTRRYMRDGRAPMLGNIPMNGYRATGAGDGVDAQDYVTLAQVQALIASIASIPTGAMMFMASTVVPAGWLALNGQTISRETYAALWAYAQASGNIAATEGAKTAGQFGPGNGATTFSLPNLYADSGYFLRPLASGRTIGSVQADEFKSHTHSGITTQDGVHNHTYPSNGLTGTGGFYGTGSTAQGNYPTSFNGLHNHNLLIDASGGTETRPKNIAYPVLIKT